MSLGVLSCLTQDSKSHLFHQQFVKSSLSLGEMGTFSLRLFSAILLSRITSPVYSSPSHCQIANQSVTVTDSGLFSICFLRRRYGNAAHEQELSYGVNLVVV